MIFSHIFSSIETWQCSEKCVEKVWTAPKSFEFEVDRSTMRAPYKTIDNDMKGWNSNHPTCIYCEKPARPSYDDLLIDWNRILMFGDNAWVHEHTSGRVYQRWKSALKELMDKDPTRKFVILEIGCGLRVRCYYIIHRIVRNSHAVSHYSVDDVVALNCRLDSYCEMAI